MKVTSGAVAQLGERLNGIQEVVGSIPIGSTITNPVLKRNWKRDWILKLDFSFLSLFYHSSRFLSFALFSTTQVAPEVAPEYGRGGVRGHDP